MALLSGSEFEKSIHTYPKVAASERSIRKLLTKSLKPGHCNASVPPRAQKLPRSAINGIGYAIRRYAQSRAPRGTDLQAVCAVLN
jgi:hypothetical protein